MAPDLHSVLDRVHDTGRGGTQAAVFTDARSYVTSGTGAPELTSNAAWAFTVRHDDDRPCSDPADHQFPAFVIQHVTGPGPGCYGAVRRSEDASRRACLPTMPPRQSGSLAGPPPTMMPWSSAGLAWVSRHRKACRSRTPGRSHTRICPPRSPPISNGSPATEVDLCTNQAQYYQVSDELRAHPLRRPAQSRPRRPALPAPTTASAPTASMPPGGQPAGCRSASSIAGRRGDELDEAWTAKASGGRGRAATKPARRPARPVPRQRSRSGSGRNTSLAGTPSSSAVTTARYAGSSMMKRVSVSARRSRTSRKPGPLRNTHLHR